jgi:general stress protein 26
MGIKMKKEEQRFIDFISQHTYLTLATVSDEGIPMAHTVGYISEGTIIYFLTHKATRKVHNILSNSTISYTVDEHSMESPVRGAQMEGKASIVSECSERQEAISRLTEKYPPLTSFASSQDCIIIKLEPARGRLIGNRNDKDTLEFNN